MFPQASEPLPHLHLRVHVSVDGRQPVDRLLGGGGALTIRENTFLVIIECLQMGVVPWHLQLVSGRETKEMCSVSKLYLFNALPSASISFGSSKGSPRASVAQTI